MTYKLNPEIEKIKTSVLLILPDGSRQEYRSGAEAAAAVFDRHYVIDEIRAVDSRIIILVTELKPMPTSWTGEEQTFF